VSTLVRRRSPFIRRSATEGRSPHGAVAPRAMRDGGRHLRFASLRGPFAGVEQRRVPRRRREGIGQLQPRGHAVQRHKGVWRRAREGLYASLSWGDAILSSAAPARVLGVRQRTSKRARHCRRDGRGSHCFVTVLRRACPTAGGTKAHRALGFVRARFHASSSVCAHLGICRNRKGGVWSREARVRSRTRVNRGLATGSAVARERRRGLPAKTRRATNDAWVISQSQIVADPHPAFFTPGARKGTLRWKPLGSRRSFGVSRTVRNA